MIILYLIFFEFIKKCRRNIVGTLEFNIKLKKILIRNVLPDYPTRSGVLELIGKEKEHVPVGYVKMYFKRLLSIGIKIHLNKYLKQKKKKQSI